MFKFYILLLFLKKNCFHEDGRIDKRTNALKPSNLQKCQGLSSSSLHWNNFNNGVTQQSTPEGGDVSFELMPMVRVPCPLHSHEDSQIFRGKVCCQLYAWAHMLSLVIKNKPNNNGDKEAMDFFKLLH